MQHVELKKQWEVKPGIFIKTGAKLKVHEKAAIQLEKAGMLKVKEKENGSIN